MIKEKSIMDIEYKAIDWDENWKMGPAASKAMKSYLESSVDFSPLRYDGKKASSKSLNSVAKQIMRLFPEEMRKDISVDIVLNLEDWVDFDFRYKAPGCRIDKGEGVSFCLIFFAVDRKSAGRRGKAIDRILYLGAEMAITGCNEEPQPRRRRTALREEVERYRLREAERQRKTKEAIDTVKKFASFMKESGIASNVDEACSALQQALWVLKMAGAEAAVSANMQSDADLFGGRWPDELKANYLRAYGNGFLKKAFTKPR